MIHEQEMIPKLYKKLLNLYPRTFKERLGESMEQTFHDLYKEHRAESAVYGFVLWTFAETGAGVFREHVLLVMEGATLKTMISNPRWAPPISFVLCVLPFMFLEWVTRSNAPRSDASPMLWVFLWLLSTIFIAILMTILRNLWQAGNSSIMANPVSLLFRVVFVVLFAWLWGALILDQMPCFLGGGGC
jgi:hypothetical protein